MRMFADPYKQCLICDQWVVWNYGALPDHERITEQKTGNEPCGHKNYVSVCPSWWPVDGCSCQAMIAHGDMAGPMHPVPPGTPQQRASEGVVW